MTLELVVILCLVSWGIYTLSLNARNYCRKRVAKRRLSEKSVHDVAREFGAATRSLGLATAREAVESLSRVGFFFDYRASDFERPGSDEIDPLDHDPLLEEFEKLEQEVEEREAREARRIEEWQEAVRRDAEMAELVAAQAKQSACDHHRVTALETYTAVDVPRGSQLYNAGWRNVGATHQCDDCGGLHFECMGMRWPVPSPPDTVQCPRCHAVFGEAGTCLCSPADREASPAIWSAST